MLDILQLRSTLIYKDGSVIQSVHFPFMEQFQLIDQEVIYAPQKTTDKDRSASFAHSENSR